jgi:hypothetical protein
MMRLAIPEPRLCVSAFLKIYCLYMLLCILKHAVIILRFFMEKQLKEKALEKRAISALERLDLIRQACYASSSRSR